MATTKSDREDKQGCKHYSRGCRLVCACCPVSPPAAAKEARRFKEFWCRHCHNDEAGHVLDRRKDVVAVTCAACGEAQAPAEACWACGARFGAYVCLQCNFFDDDISKGHFHCDECGICRVGGRENFFHCKTCNACYTNDIKEKHNCVLNSMAGECPICFENLFESTTGVLVLRCGHTIHRTCLDSLVEHGSYQCPCCCRSLMPAEIMQTQWAAMDDIISRTPMPAELQVQVQVLCNDCNAKSGVRLHVVGHKCACCGGYNTRRI